MRERVATSLCALLAALVLQACTSPSARAGAYVDSNAGRQVADGAMPNERPCRPARTGVELTQEVSAQLPPRMSSVVTPIFPLQWPDTGTGVAAFAYRIDVPPTGRRTRSVTGPTHQMTFGTLGATPMVDRLSDTPLLGTEDSGDAPSADFAEQMNRAVDAMVEVLAGCRTPESARADLAPYLTWLARYRLMGADLRQRTPAFIDWLSKPR